MQNISGIYAFEIKYFDRIVVPVKGALTSFIDAQDIGEITAKVLSEPEKHQNKGYSITGPEAKILSEELGRPITYANPKPSLAKIYWIDIRGLDKEYSTVMGMLYMMTRMGTAKKVTTVFEDVIGKKPQTFRQFVKYYYYKESAMHSHVHFQRRIISKPFRLLYNVKFDEERIYIVAFRHNM